MAILQIPVRSDLPAYEFQIELESALYTLGFTYNTRASCWVMDIMDEAGLPILMGIKIITGWLLTSNKEGTKAPLGDFYVYDTSGKKEDPTIDDFGKTKLLFYADVAEALNG